MPDTFEPPSLDSIEPEQGKFTPPPLSSEEFSPHGEWRAAPTTGEAISRAFRKTARETVPHSLGEAALTPLSVLTAPLRIARDVYQGVRYGGTPQPSPDEIRQAEEQAFRESRAMPGAFDKVFPPFTAEDIAAHADGAQGPAALGAAAWNSARQLPRFFTTLPGVATLAGGGVLAAGPAALAATGHRVIQGGFAVDLASGLPSQLEQSRAALADPNTGPLESAEAVVNPYMTAALVAATTKGALTKTKEGTAVEPQEARSRTAEAPFVPPPIESIEPVAEPPVLPVRPTAEVKTARELDLEARRLQREAEQEAARQAAEAERARVIPPPVVEEPALPPNPLLPVVAAPTGPTPDEIIAARVAADLAQHEAHLAEGERLRLLNEAALKKPIGEPPVPRETRVDITPTVIENAPPGGWRPEDKVPAKDRKIIGEGTWIEWTDDYGKTRQGKVGAVWKTGRIIPGQGAEQPRIEYSTDAGTARAEQNPRIIDEPAKPVQPTERANEPEQQPTQPPRVDVREPAGPGAPTPPVEQAGPAPRPEGPAGAPDGGSSPAGAGDASGRGVPSGAGKRPGAGGRPGDGGQPAGPRAVEGAGADLPPAGVSAEQQRILDGTKRVGDTAPDLNHVLPQDADWIPAGDRAKVRANLDAIKLLKQLESENRNPTPEEKAKLAQYTGWGGLKAIFDEGKAAYRERPGWNDEQRNEAANWEKAWGKLYDEVGSTLTPEEHAAAAKSILNAHYTSRDIIKAVWSGVQRLGFKGGTALEPAAGVGHFLGLMPEGLRGKVRWNAVELDSISGRIAQKLYPEARVQGVGFEQSRLAPNSQDLVISNVPFAAGGPMDKRYPKLSLHNYFFARSLDVVKPGGIVAAITSDSTMDGGRSKAAREYFAGKADLVGAIRLPNTAFKKNAGTEVTTDILFFRKRDGTPFKGEDFTRTVPAETYKGEPIELNEYYAKHPEMMLGRMSKEGTMYGPDQQALIPTPGADLNRQLEEAIGKLPENVFGSTPIPAGAATAEVLADKSAKLGGLTLHKDGRVMLANATGWLELPDWGADAKKQAQAKAYVGVRDAAKDIIGKQLSTDATEADLKASRAELNKAYDAYVKKHGPLNERRSQFLDDDVDFPLALALEDKQSRLVKVNGKDRREETYTKSKLFTERTLFPRVAPTHVDTVEDGLQVSQNFAGKVDINYISHITGRTPEEVMRELDRTGQAFENPASGQWENRATYLSGFVKQKLAEARAAAESNPHYARQVAELEAVQPPPIAFGNIGFKLGSVFVPERAVEQFLRDQLQVGASVNFTPQTGKWSIAAQSGHFGERNKTLFGIHEWKGHELVEQSLNLKSAVVMKTVAKEGGGTTEVRDAAASLEAQQKQDTLQKAFKEYVSRSPELAAEIEQVYNDRYNGVVAPKFEPPTWAHYPGASTEKTLRPHQKAVVTRMLQNSTLLAHAVGTGKTLAMTTAAMEMRRLGLAKKPMIVVQNATLEQFAAAFKAQYPTARILVPNAKQRDAQNRNKTMARIATGDWDSVIIPQSFINMLPDDPARESGYIRDRIDEMESAKLEAAAAQGKKSPKAADMQRAIDRLETKLKDLAARKVDNVLTFEQLGVDALFVDEAHAYKKLEFTTQMDNIKGLDTSASQRGWSMSMKTRWVQEKNQGRNVVFATGTPVSNTIAEAWNMMRYVRPDVLKAYGIEKFDEFASTFGDTVTGLEMTPGGTWKPVTRFARFTNGPELIAAWRTVADVVTPEEINLPGLPALKNGKPTVHVIAQSPTLRNYVGFLRSELERFAALSGKQKRDNSHIPLVVFGLAKKASLDMRMIDPTLADQPGSKLNVAADTIAQIYRDSTSVKGAQMVFSDAFQDNPENPRFNLYQEVKKKLIERGVPEGDIAIITADIKDAKREALFTKVNDGDLRIVLGSTERMGVGVNAQKHLVGLHHLDAPPRPMDIEQRNGRILRQGNQNPEVEVHTYGVENTLDAAMFQKLATKQKFINQILRGDLQGRNFEDAANEQSLTFEEQMAAFSGDKRAMEKVGLENQVRQLEMLRSGHHEQVRKGAETIRQLTNTTIPYQAKQLAEAQRRAAVFGDAFGPDKDFTLNVGEHTIMGRKEVVEALDKVFKGAVEGTLKTAREQNLFGGSEVPMGNITLNGQRIDLSGMVVADAKGVINPANVRVGWKFADGQHGGTGTTGQGFVQSLTATLERIAAQPDFYTRSLGNEQRNLRELTGFVQQPFEREVELAKAREQLGTLTAALEAEGKAKPEGEATHEMAEGGAQTGTPQFKNWFGQSKVVDAQGKPLVVYHGTDADFSAFRLNDKQVGIWFSTSPDTASRYANIRGRWNDQAAEKVIPAYLSLQNPAPYDVMDRITAKVRRTSGATEDIGKVVREKLIALGYDGVSVDGGESFIAFRPNQVKSSTGNSGAFDPNVEVIHGFSGNTTLVQAAAQDVARLRNLVAPQTAGGPARFAGNLLRELNAKMANELARADVALAKFRRDFDRTPVNTRKFKYDPTLPLPRNLAFIDAYESGNVSALSKLDQTAAAEFHKLNTADVARVRALGTGALTTFYANYFPHIWEDPKAAAAVFGKLLGHSPLEGPKSFLKQRTHQLFADGLAAGLKPVHDNPVDLWLLKKREIERFILAHNFTKQMKAADLMKFKYAFAKAPDGWRTVDDSAFSVYGPPTVTVKEAYDAGMRQATLDVLANLGVPHERVTRLGKEWGKEIDTPGVPGSERIKSRFAGPDFVIWHELGHVLHNRYSDLEPILTATDLMKVEIEALARARTTGTDPASFKRYVQTTPEKMAVVLQAFLHAPDEMHRLAPTVKTAFDSFLNSHPELAQIRDIRPSLRLGVGEAELTHGGLLKLGDYVMPEAAANVVNNFLSPGLNPHLWYRAIRQTSNLLNGVQLGLSAFHLGFTSLDAATSRLAVAMEDAARGKIGKALTTAATVPVSPVTNIHTGAKLRAEVLSPGTHPEMAALAKALEQAGGRVGQDAFWQTEFTRRMTRAWHEGGLQWGTLPLRVPLALWEQTMRPILEYVVPRQKLGVFADMAQREIEKLGPSADAGATREALRKAWDSVDNRMGQVVYDNLFYNRAVKDVALIAFRAYGWQLGKYREGFGAMTDTGAAVGKLAKGERPEFSHRMAYAMALPLMVGTIGGMMHYLMTGQQPQDSQDYFQPQTGERDKNGNPVRLNLPSYVKDALAYAKHPLTSFGHSLNPLLSSMFDLLQNRDFYNVEIRHPDDPLTRQGGAVAEFAAKQFIPFSVAGTLKLREDAAPLQKQILPFFGVTPVPQRMTMTPAQELSSEITGNRMPSGPRTREQADASKLVKELVAQIRAGSPPDERWATLTPGQFKTMVGHLGFSPFQFQVHMMPAADAMRVWRVASPTERQTILPIMAAKVVSAANSKNLTAEKAQQIKKWADEIRDQRGR